MSSILFLVANSNSSNSCTPSDCRSLCHSVTLCDTLFPKHKSWWAGHISISRTRHMNTIRSYVEFTRHLHIYLCMSSSLDIRLCQYWKLSGLDIYTYIFMYVEFTRHTLVSSDRLHMRRLGYWILENIFSLTLLKFGELINIIVFVTLLSEAMKDNIKLREELTNINRTEPWWREQGCCLQHHCSRLR